MNEPHVLDEAALAKLRQIGGASLVSEMITIFLRNAPGRLSEAMAAQAAGNMEPIERAGHSLKSGCGYVGATGMRELAIRLERAAREGDAQTTQSLLQALEEAWAAVGPRLQAELREAEQRDSVPDRS